MRHKHQYHSAIYNAIVKNLNTKYVYLSHRHILYKNK